MLKKISGILLSTLLGLVFIYSGYTKLWPVIETFEFTFVETGLANWYTAPVMARLLIGLEFFTGILLLACYRLRKLTGPLTIGLLLFFVVYLTIQITVSGNSGNCGCFGEHIHMTPLQALLKNLVMIVMAFAAMKLYEGWSLKYRFAVPLTFAIVAFAVPFVVNPIDYSYTSNNLEEKVNYPLELNLLYAPDDSSKVEIPTVDLRKGKHVLAFMSLSCPHCRIAAKKFRLIKKNNPSLPIYFILNGDKQKKYAEFIQDTHADNIPSSFCLGKTFIRLSSAHLPRIYYLDNGMVVKKVDYYELNQYAIENWIGTGTP